MELDNRTDVSVVSVVWKQNLNGNWQVFEHVLTNHPQGLVFGYLDRQDAKAVFTRAVLDPATGNVLQQRVLERLNAYCSWSDAILHTEAGEIHLETEGGPLVLVNLPQAEGWLHCLQREDGLVLLGYDLEGRFITYLDELGETRWTFRPERRGPREIYVLETYGSRERLIDLGNGLLGAYGPSIRGLLALDAQTGQLVWEYHIPIEDHICSVAVSDDGIWVGGLSYDYGGVVALLAPDGTVLRELEHSAPVVAIGALSEKACWFMAGWGPEGENRVYLLENDRLAQEVLGGIEFGPVPQIDSSLLFVDGSKGILYCWRPGQAAEAYELPFNEGSSGVQMLGARDDKLILRYKSEVYAVTLGN